MKVGLNFLPTVGPGEMPAERFYDEIIELSELADRLSFSHVKLVEHHFHEWGGYSPDPVALLSAIARRTTRVRLVTGAVTPAFTHPIKLAASLSVLDNLSHGRLDAGFGRAFLPSEFEAFGVDMADSRALLEENVEAVERLWTDEGFRWEGRFHRFGPLPAMLPRPAQLPRPPVFIAATTSPETFTWAASKGYHLMIIPVVASHEKLTGLLDLYRATRIEHGHSPTSDCMSATTAMWRRARTRRWREPRSTTPRTGTNSLRLTGVGAASPRTSTRAMSAWNRRLARPRWPV
ncbi:hypothetical protein SANT12839_009570 [Streptomyces antimycoticus]|uniref:Luciferase-like domain-containing protein n=1 Tax=Streptomyces antimycoticus TaxID=68175 RepID=A0A4D4JTN5_9ACTN|nr:LLM class flavin-dependent oxidoreductase [Streptomyces antimycoticus]GDY40075.1 hypothetical protein SANT12839_009570 [Streptomyces antimycoticus]